jgi:hypothetical protein
MLDKHGSHCFIVGKRGRTAGVIWGCANEIMSVTRNPLGDGTEFFVREWVIIPRINRAFEPFSEAGDSSSAVFDVIGQVGGILTGGTRLSGILTLRRWSGS